MTIDNDLDFIEEDAHAREKNNSIENLNQEDVGSLTFLTKRLRAETGLIAELDEKLKTAKTNKRKTTDEDIPSLISSIAPGFRALVLDDGSRVEVKPFYSGRISENNKESAHQWLRNNGYGDIIKNIVTFSFGKDEDDKAHKLIELAISHGFFPMRKEAVNPMTLKTFIRERHEDGEYPPEKLFEVYVGQRATLKGGS